AMYHINRERQRADEEATRAKRAEQETREQLGRSYLAQARATRWSGRTGRRFECLDVLKQAAAIGPSLELRNEAIARLGLTDVRKKRDISIPADNLAGPVLMRDECYFRFDRQGKISLHAFSNDREVMSLSAPQSPIQGVYLSQDGRFFSARSGTNPVCLAVWDLTTRQVVLQVTNRN